MGLLNFVTEDGRQLMDCGRLENCRQTQSLAKCFLDLRDYAHGQQGVATQIEKPVPNANGMNTEDFFPNGS